MTIDLVFVGFGEHASVVADAAASCDGSCRIVGYTDRAPSPIARRHGATFLGSDEAYLERFVANDALRFVLGVGGTAVSSTRTELARRYEERGALFAGIVHSTAWISPSARIEDGAVILAGAIVNSGAHIGRHAIVNTGSIIEHDVDVGAFGIVAPGAVIGGGARIGEGSYIGLGARVRDHATIGAGTMVGMGAVVVADVGDDAVVVGVPARPLAPRTLR